MGPLSTRAIDLSAISYKPKINIRTVQRERNGDGVRIATGQQEGEEQDGTKSTTGQATVPDESRADVSVHGFCKWVTADHFDMQIVHLYAGSYLRQTSAKALATAEKDKKENYLQPCLKCRPYFTPMM